MTKQQQAKVEWLKREILLEHVQVGLPESITIDSDVTEQPDGQVFVSSMVRISDGGIAASFDVVIGPRGGMRVLKLAGVTPGVALALSNFLRVRTTRRVPRCQ